MIARKHGRKTLFKFGVILFTLPFFVFLGCTRQVSWIHMEPKSVELNKLDETFQIKAAALDKENKPVPEATLTWESSNPEVATVDNNGLLTAKGSGNTVITALAANGEKAVLQCKVSILSSIVVEPAELTLKVGEKHELKTKVLNEKGELFEDQMVGWASADASVVFVDDLGTITAVAPGEAMITATTPSKELSHVYGSSKITVTASE